MSSQLTDLGRLVWFGLAMTVASLVQGQGVLSFSGTEYSVSGAMAGDQILPAVAVGANGGYAVWQDNSVDARATVIQARRVDVSGNAIGSVFRVSRASTNSQEVPQVAVLNDGGAVFVWQGGKVGFQSVMAQFMGANGALLATDVQVSQPMTAQTNRMTVALPVVRNNRSTFRRFRVSQIVERRRDYNNKPAVAVLADGSVLIAYAGYQRMNTNEPVVLPSVFAYGSEYVTNSVLIPYNKGGKDDMLDVFVRRYTAAGQPWRVNGKIEGEVRINQNTRFSQRSPSIAVLADGSYVVAWVSEHQGVSDADVMSGRGRMDIYARLFNASGVAVGNEFMLNMQTATQNGAPVLAATQSGGFRAAWEQASTVSGDYRDIVTRAFDAQGNPVTHVVMLNSVTAKDQTAPRIASNALGELVTWVSRDQDGSREGVYGRWLSGGSVAGNEIHVSTATFGPQYQPAVTTLPGNQFLAVWAALNSGSAFDIMGQRFSSTTP